MLQREVDAGKHELRALLETSGYSRWISDAVVDDAVTKILLAAEKVRLAHKDEKK